MEATAPESSKAIGSLPDSITLALSHAIRLPKFPYQGQPIHAWLAINAIIHDIRSWPNLKPVVDQYTDPLELKRLETGMLGMLIKEEPYYELLGLFCLDIPGFEPAWDTIGENLQFKILMHWKAILEAASTYQDQDLALNPIALRRMELNAQLQAEFDRHTQGFTDEAKQLVKLGVRLTLDVLAGVTPESPGYMVMPLGGPDDNRPDLHEHFGRLFEPNLTQQESLHES